MSACELRFYGYGADTPVAYFADQEGRVLEGSGCLTRAEAHTFLEGAVVRGQISASERAQLRDQIAVSALLGEIPPEVRAQLEEKYSFLFNERPST